MSSGAAVNVPTNFKIKEKDVNAKLQLYGIYSGESCLNATQVDVLLTLVSQPLLMAKFHPYDPSSDEAIMIAHKILITS